MPITISRLVKSFGKRCVFDGLNLHLRDGEIVAFRGDNGCGKTTLLNILAGIEPIDSGGIEIEGLGNEFRLGYAQQDYGASLLPWLTALENVAFPLRLQRVAASVRRHKARTLLEALAFRSIPTESYPHQLSGGQKQRLVIARSLIRDPQLVIMDEPFASLDAHSSRDLQETLLRIHEGVRPTILLVSHDLDHCIYLADRIVILHGSPAQIVQDFRVPLRRPRSRQMILGRDYLDIRAKILSYEEEIYAQSRS